MFKDTIGICCVTMIQGGLLGVLSSFGAWSGIGVGLVVGLLLLFIASSFSDNAF